MSLKLYMDVHIPRALTSGRVGTAWTCSPLRRTREISWTTPPCLTALHQEKLPIGKVIDDLELMAKVYEPEDMANRVEYLPL